jgi:hypothetical protein
MEQKQKRLPASRPRPLRTAAAVWRGARPWRARLVLAAALAGVLLAAHGDARAVARFGTRCQADYQAGWQNTLPYMWDRCGWFVSELDATDTSVFYFSLHNSKTRYSTCDSCGTGVDDVALMYTGTHGGAINDTNARLAMWEQNVRALSNSDSWRFGDEATGCSIFAQYACETLTAGDSNNQMKDRWRGAFRGGLRIATGSHDKLWDSITTNETGEDFADDLQDGKSVKWAWFDGNGDWWEDQDVKVLATGSNSSNCASRRDGIKWQNFTSFGRLRDGNLDWWCWSRIDNN